MVVDLRSDTVTVPTPEMRHAMATAEVGDDFLGEDPTARRLEERVNELFGPLVAFGTGGIVGQLVNDLAFRGLPLSDVDARELVGSVRVTPLLLGRMGSAGSDLAALKTVH